MARNKKKEYPLPKDFREVKSVVVLGENPFLRNPYYFMNEYLKDFVHREPIYKSIMGRMK